MINDFECKKRPYERRSQANKIMKTMKRMKGVKSPSTLMIYFCWKCRAYHVGHNSRGVEKRRMSRKKRHKYHGGSHEF